MIKKYSTVDLQPIESANVPGWMRQAEAAQESDVEKPSKKVNEQEETADSEGDE